MWFLIRVRKRRSRILDMLFRLEMGLELEKTSEQETISGVGMKSIGDDLGTMPLRRLNTSK